MTLRTFRYDRQPGEGAVLMISGFAQGGRSARELHPLADTNTMERTWDLPDEYLGTYLFWVGKEGVDLPEDFEDLLPIIYSDAGRAVPDPDNPDQFVYPVDPEQPGPAFVQSIVRQPKSISEPFVGAPLLGTLTEHRLASAHMGDERRVWVHESTGIDPSGPPPALMVVFDGGIYAHLLHTPEVLDALVVAGEFPPTVTLYCHYASEDARHAELMCRNDFAAFVAEELVPWAEQRWRFTSDPSRTVTAGSSLGGLGAAWMALTHPERFGNVIANSPSFGWHPEGPAYANWLAEQWSLRGPTATRLYVEMGDFEDTAPPEQFVAMALSHGNDAVFERFCGGHDYLSWRATFPRALRWLGSRL